MDEEKDVDSDNYESPTELQDVKSKVCEVQRTVQKTNTMLDTLINSNPTPILHLRATSSSSSSSPRNGIQGSSSVLEHQVAQLTSRVALLERTHAELFGKINLECIVEMQSMAHQLSTMQAIVNEQNRVIDELRTPARTISK